MTLKCSVIILFSACCVVFYQIHPYSVDKDVRHATYSADTNYKLGSALVGIRIFGISYFASVSPLRRELK